MKKILTIAQYRLKLILKDKSSLIWMFLAPLIFVTVIVYGFSGTNTEKKISVVDQEKSEYSRILKEQLQRSGYQVTESDYKEARNDIVEGKIVAGVVIPQGFKESLGEDAISLKILQMQDSKTTIMLTNLLDACIKQIKIGVKSGKETIELVKKYQLPKETKGLEETVETAYFAKLNPEKVVIDSSEYQDISSAAVLNSLSYDTMGILIIFIMFAVLNCAGNILTEKQNGTWSRLTITKANAVEIILGNFLGIFTVGWIQVGGLILFSKYIYEVNWGGSVIGIILLFSSFLMCVTGITVVLGNVCGSKKQLTGMTAIIVMSTSLLGGCMWSRDLMSDILIKVSSLTPQSWVLLGITDLVARGNSLSAIREEMTALLVFAFLGLLLGVVSMRKKRLRIG